MAGFPPIVVRQPRWHDIVDNPVAVSGIGTGFEGRFAARVRDANGAELAEVTIQAGGTGIWGSFHTTLALPNPPATPQGLLEVFEYSAADGGEINKVIVRITFGAALLNPYHGFAQYTVVAGDTLSRIAAQWYGNGADWPRIFEANRHQLLQPNLIFPGQVLRIPQ